MKSLNAGATPQAKRRKLEHIPELQDEPVQADHGPEDRDEVEEPEEEPEASVDGDAVDDDDDEDASNPFEVHFADPNENILSQRLKALQKNEWEVQKNILPNFSKVISSIPKTDDVKSGVSLGSASSPKELKLKQKLAGVIEKQQLSFDDLEKHIAPLIFGYQDILFCERTTSNSESLRRLTCLHAVNHVLK